MSDPIEAAAIAYYARQQGLSIESATKEWNAVLSATWRGEYCARVATAISAYRDAEIEALRAQLAEAQAVVRAVAEEVGKVKCEDGEQGPCFDDGVVEQCDNCRAKSRALALLEVKP